MQPTPPSPAGYRFNLIALGVVTAFINLGLALTAKPSTLMSFTIGAVTGSTLIVFYLSWQRLTR